MSVLLVFTNINPKTVLTLHEKSKSYFFAVKKEA